MNTIACGDMLGPATFGEALRNRRTERGLTIGALAATTGIERATISRYENGRGEPQPVYRYALRTALGLHEDDDHGWWKTDW